MAMAMAAAAAMAALLVLMVAAVQNDRVADLVQRQAGAKDGVVGLDDAAVRHLAASSDRPYALLIFFDALQLRERSELKLEELKAEFALVAQAYIKNNAGTDGESKIFFCSVEFQQSQASFGMFGVSSLPHIRYLPPGSASVNSSEGMEMNDLARSAEGMASFVESRIKHKVGHIGRPPFISKQQLFVLAGGLAVAAPFVIKKLTAHDDTPFHDPKVWCAGALFVYFFSVSGGMHNIIRKMPLFMADRKNPGKLVFFYQGSGMQLGAEGFVVGYLYTVLGLIVAFVTHILVTFKSKTLQRLIMLVGMAVCFWSVSKVVSLDNWKTGYEVHAYLPRSWR